MRADDLPDRHTGASALIRSSFAQPAAEISSRPVFRCLNNGLIGGMLKTRYYVEQDISRHFSALGPFSSRALSHIMPGAGSKALGHPASGAGVSITTFAEQRVCFTVSISTLAPLIVMAKDVVRWTKRQRDAWWVITTLLFRRLLLWYFCFLLLPSGDPPLSQQHPMTCDNPSKAIGAPPGALSEVSQSALSFISNQFRASSASPLGCTRP